RQSLGFMGLRGGADFNGAAGWHSTLRPAALANVFWYDLVRGRRVASSEWRKPMYARVTTYQADPARIEELRAKLRAIKAKVEDMDGLLDWYTVWSADGKGVVFTVFENKADADASLNEVRNIWASVAGLLKGTPKPENFDNVETLED